MRLKRHFIIAEAEWSMDTSNIPSISDCWMFCTRREEHGNALRLHFPQGNGLGLPKGFSVPRRPAGVLSLHRAPLPSQLLYSPCLDHVHLLSPTYPIPCFKEEERLYKEDMAADTDDTDDSEDSEDASGKGGSGQDSDHSVRHFLSIGG